MQEITINKNGNYEMVFTGECSILFVKPGMVLYQNAAGEQIKLNILEEKDRQEAFRRMNIALYKQKLFGFKLTPEKETSVVIFPKHPIKEADKEKAGFRMLGFAGCATVIFKAPTRKAAEVAKEDDYDYLPI